MRYEIELFVRSMNIIYRLEKQKVDEMVIRIVSVILDGQSCCNAVATCSSSLEHEFLNYMAPFWNQHSLEVAELKDNTIRAKNENMTKVLANSTSRSRKSVRLGIWSGAILFTLRHRRIRPKFLKKHLAWILSKTESLLYGNPHSSWWRIREIWLQHSNNYFYAHEHSYRVGLCVHSSLFR